MNKGKILADYGRLWDGFPFKYQMYAMINLGKTLGLHSRFDTNENGQVVYEFRTHSGAYGGRLVAMVTLNVKG